MFQQIWKDAVWSKVIASAILALIAYVASSSSWIEHLLDNFVAPSAVSNLKVPFSVYNGFSVPGAFIWVPDEADIQIIEPVASTQTPQLLSAKVRLEMPNTFRLSGRPQVDPNSTEKGYALLPRNIDFKKFMDRGLVFRLSITLQPNGQILHQEHVLDSNLASTEFDFKVFP